MSPAAAPETFPLNDPRWLPMTGVFARLSQPLGGRHVAEHDVNEALALGDLHCLYRYRMVNGLWERRLVSFLCWASHKLMCWGDGVITVRVRNIADGPPAPCSALRRDIHLGGAHFPLPGTIAIDTRIRGVFHGWEPDLQRLWSRIFLPMDLRKDEEADEESDEESDVDRLDVWLAELYRHDEWLFLPATTVHRDITARAKQLTAKGGKQVPGLSYTAVREGLNEKRKSRKSQK